MNNLHYVGFIKKTHGFKGAVKLCIERESFTPKSTEPLFLEYDKKGVPFFIQSLSGEDTEWLVTFDDIDSVDLAEDLVGRGVFAESAGSGDFLFPDSEIIGYTLVDKHLGETGQVISLIEKPGQDLLEVQHPSGSFFIPFVPEMFTDVDHHRKIIYADLPDGLVQLNS